MGLLLLVQTMLTSNQQTNQDWNSAWGSDGEEDEAEEVSAQNGERHRRSLEEERRASAVSSFYSLSIHALLPAVFLFNF